jgi:DNA-binding transcriptional ArsR family regulator
MAVLVLAALADPVRREIVELLAAGEAGAGEIAERFPVTRPAVSRHLRVLREAGLVTSEVRAQRRVYRLQRAPLAELDAWLERFRPLPGRGSPAAPSVPTGLANRLDALDTEIRRGRRRRTPENGEAHDDRTAG